MNITETRIHLIDDPKLRAFVTITVDNSFVVHGLKIICGRSGLFVAMPNRKLKNGEYQDIVHPINREARAILEEVIIRTYQETLDKGQELAGVAAQAPFPSPPGYRPQHTEPGEPEPEQKPADTDRNNPGLEGEV